MAALVLAGLLLLLLLEWRLGPALEAVAATQARWVATEAMQQAVLDKITGQVSYNNLIQPGSSDGGQVVFMQADALGISRLQAAAQLAIQERLARLQGKTYYLPLGQILGLKLLAAYGPPVPLRFVPMGTVKVNVGDTFESAGINQTRHRIYLQAESEVQVVAPFSREKVQVATTIPVAEAIIVGPVPQTYVSLGSEMLKGILRAPGF
ncbi:sporulation protein YunB [Neomoorella thermoacetica]|uniref:sporulation protein YunB n=1 Tax=Neomoorella thermoacetica TaxID=1525 RepID=UPI000314EE57|nr:sporulation protein YunB [Moorella thermoacetica]AKX94509.1 sporulation protein YunB [Moorella thermoacetica]AKX97145.1 sporulation protein YunB [Moorella thermoacetica]OIQ55150.1 sporulation protein YunB [Moorella thermoacetica]OIQ57436.1 sporulation protein YunB [Moorella thermoacetica]QDA00975.1 Sporulation protein YunB [Moorella thermoacetica]